MVSRGEVAAARGWQGAPLGQRRIWVPMRARIRQCAVLREADRSVHHSRRSEQLWLRIGIDLDQRRPGRLDHLSLTEEPCAPSLGCTGSTPNRRGTTAQHRFSNETTSISLAASTVRSAQQHLLAVAESAIFTTLVTLRIAYRDLALTCDRKRPPNRPDDNSRSVASTRPRARVCH